MSPHTVEDRLRRSLAEIAGRVPDSGEGADGPFPLAVAPEARRPGRSRWVAATVAVILGLATIVATGLARRNGGNGTPVATERPLTVITAVTSNGIGVELRRVRASGSLCVELVDSGGSEAAAPRACLSAGDGAFPVQATMVGSGTVVYGLHRAAASFTGSTVEPSAGQLREAAFEGGRAFLYLLEDRSATGAVEARAADGTVLAVGRFERGGPDRAPAGSLGDIGLDFAFAREGAIWAVGADGTEVRLTEGTPRNGNGWPSASPDGHVVLFSEIDWEGIFWKPMAVAVADGAIAPRRTFASTWSPNASKLAGMVPIDDAGAPTEVIVADAESDEELARIGLGRNDETGDVVSLAWDGEARLLALTRPANDVEVRKEVWALDVDARTATPLLLDADSLGATLVIAEQARRPGEFAAIRLRDGRAEWGQLLADEGMAIFKRRTALPTSAGGRSLDLTGRLYLDARRGGGDGYLLGDGRNLFELTEEGKLTFLRIDVERASTP